MTAATNRGAIKTIATHYIDGAFAESHGREVMDIIRPTDSQIIGHVTLADEEDTHRLGRIYATHAEGNCLFGVVQLPH